MKESVEAPERNLLRDRGAVVDPGLFHIPHEPTGGAGQEGETPNKGGGMPGFFGDLRRIELLCLPDTLDETPYSFSFAPMQIHKPLCQDPPVLVPDGISTQAVLLVTERARSPV